MRWILLATTFNLWFAGNTQLDTLSLDSLVFDPNYVITSPITDPYEFSGIWHDDEHSRNSIPCNGGSSPGSTYEENKVQYFNTYVYEPAMKNPSVSQANKEQLKRIKSYLESTKEHQSWEAKIETMPIYPVYGFTYREGPYVSLFADFLWSSNEQRLKSTALHKELIGHKAMHIYYSNTSKPATYTIKRYEDFSSACANHGTYFLHKIDTTDTRLPAFCSDLKLDLVHRSDTVMNRLLEGYNDCDNSGSYCDPSQAQISFAQLRDVPFLYFTTDTPQDSWYTYYPTRGIYLKLDNRTIIRLWDYRVEMVECSCI